MPSTETLLTTPEIEEIFSVGARVQRMMDFEAALARAQAKAGMIPSTAADAIAACCRVEFLSADRVLAEARSAGNAAIPLVNALIKVVEAKDSAAASWVHWGATSQDVQDTGMILQLRDAAQCIAAQLMEAENKIAQLCHQHLRTPMVARTLLQQASPITLGFKLAVWGDGIARARNTLRALNDDAFALQLGGAVGTLSIMGEAGARVRQDVAQQLGLSVPCIAWHVQRDRMARIGTAFAGAIFACAKPASDLMLMMQSEVAEAQENAASAGGSSAMPNKRNPVRALVPAAAAANAGGLLAALCNSAVHEHERAAGAWHGEWFALPQLAAMAHASACAMADIAGSIEFITANMRRNLESGGGLIAAEALTAALAKVGDKTSARRAVERLCAAVREHGGTLAALVRADANLCSQLGEDTMNRVFNHADAIDAAARSAEAWLAQRGAESM